MQAKNKLKTQSHCTAWYRFVLETHEKSVLFPINICSKIIIIQLQVISDIQTWESSIGLLYKVHHQSSDCIPLNQNLQFVQASSLGMWIVDDKNLNGFTVMNKANYPHTSGIYTHL